GGPSGPAVLVWPEPASPQTFIIFYYRRPNEILYSFTVSGDTEVYDEAASVHPEWPDEVVYGILIPATLQYLGVQHDSPALIQYGLTKQTQKQ
ncbi:MAG: hypothetical protein D6746_07215, partial [Bacteroidetes bacterium]